MKTLFDKSVRDAMPLSHKLMLACLAVFTLTLFFQYNSGESRHIGGLYTTTDYVHGLVHKGLPAGTGWELAPLAVPVMLVLFIVYLSDPDENIPLFRHVGWWITPFVPFLTIAVYGYETPALFVGLFALLGMLVAAGLHFMEQRANRKAAGGSPPAAPKA
jgi:hypothetical protein